MNESELYNYYYKNYSVKEAVAPTGLWHRMSRLLLKYGLHPILKLPRYFGNFSQIPKAAIKTVAKHPIASFGMGTVGGIAAYQGVKAHQNANAQLQKLQQQAAARVQAEKAQAAEAANVNGGAGLQDKKPIIPAKKLSPAAPLATPATQVTNAGNTAATAASPVTNVVNQAKPAVTPGTNGAPVKPAPTVTYGNDAFGRYKKITDPNTLAYYRNLYKKSGFGRWGAGPNWNISVDGGNWRKLPRGMTREHILANLQHGIIHEGVLEPRNVHF